MPVAEDVDARVEHRAEHGGRRAFARERELLERGELGDVAPDISEASNMTLESREPGLEGQEHGAALARRGVERASRLRHDEVELIVHEEEVVDEVLPGLRLRHEAELAVRRGHRLDGRTSRTLLDEMPELRQQVVPDEMAEVRHRLELKRHRHERARRGLKEGKELQILLRPGRRAATGPAPATSSAATASTPATAGVVASPGHLGYVGSRAPPLSSSLFAKARRVDSPHEKTARKDVTSYEQPFMRKYMVNECQ